MSDTITAAIITTLGTLLVALVVHWLNNRKRSHTEPQICINQPETNKEIKRIEESLEPQPLNQPEAPTPSTSLLLHSDIVRAIESQPPCQRDKIHESFVGSRITWNTKLQSISHHSSSVTVFADIPDGGSGSLFCNTDEENAQVFNLLPEKTPFTVSGTIEKISKYEVDLIDCSFHIKNEPNQS